MPSRLRSCWAGSADGAGEVAEHLPPGGDALVLLRVVAGRDVVAEVDGARVGGRVAGEDPHEAGLARAVEAHDEQPLAPPDGELDVSEDRRAAVALGQAVDGEDDVARPRRVREAHLDVLLLAVR